MNEEHAEQGDVPESALDAGIRAEQSRRPEWVLGVHRAPVRLCSQIIPRKQMMLEEKPQHDHQLKFHSSSQSPG